MFQSRCRDLGVGEEDIFDEWIIGIQGFSLVAEIWGLASVLVDLQGQFFAGFSLVAEIWGLASMLPSLGWFLRQGLFQSRCRDLGVGERHWCLLWRTRSLVSVSLPRFGGWRGTTWNPTNGKRGSSFSLVAEIWGLARCHWRGMSSRCRSFQSRCRDLGVGESHQGDCRKASLGVSVSLPRFGGWRARMTQSVLGFLFYYCFSLVAEIWGLASRTQGGQCR